MKNLGLVRSPSWAVKIPVDWVELESGTSSIYFESPEGDKGMFIATWKLGNNHVAEEVRDSFINTEMETMREMEGIDLSILERKYYQEGICLIGELEAHDLSNNYRIACKVLVQLPKVVRACFYDYECENLEVSVIWYQEIIESLHLVKAT